MGKLLCGVDLGGTKLSVGLVTPTGRLVDRSVAHDHAAKTAPDVIRQVRDMVFRLLERHRIGEPELTGIGIMLREHYNESP